MLLRVKFRLGLVAWITKELTMNAAKILLLGLLAFPFSLSVQAQAGAENADAIGVSTGGTFAKPKLMPKLEKLGIAQITVNYKLTSSHMEIEREKFTGKTAAAKLTSYLETTDGELTPADFQEVTDHFYSYFQRQLKANGIDTVAWSAITGTEFYQKAVEKVASNEQEKGSGQVWVTHNANQGNMLYGGGIAFAFGKMKQASRFCEEIGGVAGFFHVTVDFTDIMVNVDIKSSSSWGSGYTALNKTTSFKYEAAAKPNLKVLPSDANSNTLLWNEKMQAEAVTIGKDIVSAEPYHTGISQDPSRLKNRAFAFAKAMDPVIIETTRAQYKAAAKKALENYADAFIAKSKQLGQSK